MTKKIISLTLCVVLIACSMLCLCSCKNKKTDEFPVTVGGVTLESEPNNIVVLSPELIDIISCIRYDVKIIGRSVECDQEFLSVIPTVGSETDPDTSAIIANKADLVIVSKPLPAAAANSLKNANIPVATFNIAKNFTELKKLYTDLGTLLGGKTTGAQQGVRYYDELFASLKRFQDAVPNDILLTACYLYLDENGTLCTFTNGSIESKIFAYNGAKNVLDTQDTPQVDLQYLRLSTPQFIFVNDKTVIEYLKSEDTLKNMYAIMYDKLFVIRKADFDRHGDTFQTVVFEMMDYMFSKEKEEATADEATPDQIEPNTNEIATVEGFSEETAEILY